MRYIIPLILLLSACNSVYVKPNSLHTYTTVYADRGGYGMRKSIKQEMEKRGYKVVVGKAKGSRDFTDNSESIEIDYSSVPDNARYVIKVAERSERLAPIWCVFNGFWWWNFNISIADQSTGEELMTWRGRGCQNSSLRKFDAILDKMEKEPNEQNN